MEAALAQASVLLQGKPAAEGRAGTEGDILLRVEVPHTPLTYKLSTYIVPLTCHRHECCHTAEEEIINREMGWYRHMDAVPDTD